MERHQLRSIKTTANITEERRKKKKMTSRTILGNIVNTNIGAQAAGGKIHSVASWLTSKVSNNKENVVEQIQKTEDKTSNNLRFAVKKNNKKLCVAEVEPMEVEQEEIVPTVPEGVIDIDNEEEDVNACGEYARDIYAYLKQLEQKFAVRENYLEGSGITSKMRSLLIDWMVSVHQQFELCQETLFLSVNLLDRYLELKVLDTPRSKLQLVGVVAMLLACKVEEIYLPSIEDFVYSTNNAYSESEVKEMELTMMSVLNFDLNAPISLSFLRRYSKAGDVDVLEHTLAKYILELSLLDFGQAALPPSMAAAAALNLSLALLEPYSGTVWNMSLQYHSGYSANMLSSIVRRMATVLINAETHKLQAVREKYTSRKFRRVALIRDISGDKIKKMFRLK